MFDVRKVAEEVFSTLRSFNYEVAMFDQEGNRVYEPESATRFFTNAKNITVSLDEDGENSAIKVLLGRSTEIESVQGMLDTLRTTATKFGILFNTRKYNRELGPKDFATGSAVLEGRTLSGSTKSSYLKLEGARMIIRHDTAVDDKKHGARARNVKKVMIENSEGERFLMPSCNLGAGRAMTRHISKGGHWSDEAGQKLAEMAKQQRDLRDCARYCRQNSRKIDEDVSGLIESCINKARSYRDVFEGIYRNYDKNIGSLPESTDVVLNEDDEDFNARVDALCEKLKLEEDSVIDRKTCETVARVVEGETLTEKKVEMIALPALDCEVERAAWDAFKDSHKINLRGGVDLDAAHGGDNSLAAKVQLIANATVDDGMSNMFAKVAQRLMDGDKSTLLRHIANIAIASASGLREEDESDGDDSDAPEIDEAKAEMIDLPKFGCKVEKQAWEDLKAGKIQLRHKVEFPQMGHSANEAVIKLQEIAKQATYSGLANMLSRVADDIDMGRNTALHQQVANVAIAAATTSSEGRQDGKGFSMSMNESALIQTKAIREFGQWFDSYSPFAIFESSGFSGTYEDDYADEVDKGLDAAYDNFNVDDFLVMHGDDFDYGQDDAAEHTVSAPQLVSALSGYLADEATSHMDDTMVGTATQVGGTDEMARKLLPQVIDKLEAEGYTITEKDALESDDHDTDMVGIDILDEDDIRDAGYSHTTPIDDFPVHGNAATDRELAKRHGTGGEYIIRATDPDGEKFYCPAHGAPVKDKSAAMVYGSASAAYSACTRWYGTNQDAFWGSEVSSRAAMARDYRGWNFQPEAVIDEQDLGVHKEEEEDENLLLGGLEEGEDDLAPEDVLLPNNPSHDLRHDVAAHPDRPTDGEDEDLNRMLTLAGMKRAR